MSDLWDILNSTSSSESIADKLLAIGYTVVSWNVESPVGDVPYGSPVLFEKDEERAVWLLGNVYQIPGV